MVEAQEGSGGKQGFEGGDRHPMDRVFATDFRKRTAPVYENTAFGWMAAGRRSADDLPDADRLGRAVVGLVVP
jgi:hypothetical protein